MNRSIFILFLFASTILPQTSKIIKIIDSNLFQLSDSTLIKLAGVDIPRLNYMDYDLHKAAEAALSFCRRNLEDKEFNVNILHSTMDYKLVYLFREDLLNGRKLNLFFLEEGFGKYVNNINAEDTLEFRSAEKKAKEKNAGIWKLLGINQSSLLDRANSDEFLLISDSLKKEMLKYQKPNVGYILGELLIGPAFGLSAAYFARQLFPGPKDEIGGDNQGTIMITMYGAYLLGNTLGVNLLAAKTTKEVNFGRTLFASLMGGIMGATIFAIHPSAETASFTILLPVISSVLYVNVMAPERFTNRKLVKEYNFQSDDLNAATLYNNTILMNFELLRINF